MIIYHMGSVQKIAYYCRPQEDVASEMATKLFVPRCRFPYTRPSAGTLSLATEEYYNKIDQSIIIND